MKNFWQNHILKVAFAQSVLAMVGSLYFSEVMKLEPCKLCWYQRIAMYPLAAIFLIGLFRKDKNVAWYALPLSLIGLIIAIYHNIIYYSVIPSVNQICTTAVSCTTRFFTWFGFVTIPLLSLTAFLVINACLLIYLKYGRDTLKANQNI